MTDVVYTGRLPQLAREILQRAAADCKNLSTPTKEKILDAAHKRVKEMYPEYFQGASK